jgi:hypothetical protein
MADPLSQTSLSPSSVYLLVLFGIHIGSSCQTFFFTTDANNNKKSNIEVSDNYDTQNINNQKNY